MKATAYSWDSRTLTITWNGGQLSFKPAVHAVKQVRKFRSDWKGFLVRSFVMFLLLILVVIALNVVGSFFQNSGWATVVFGGASLGALTVFFYTIIPSEYKRLISRPEQATADNALEAYLRALEDKNYQRAYSLLTDEGQGAVALNLPRENELEKVMPPVRYDSADSFSHFWSSIPFKWSIAPAASEPAARNKFAPREIYRDDSTCILAVYIQTEKRRFSNYFCLVKRQAGGQEEQAWYIVNGFIWPWMQEEEIAETQKRREAAEAVLCNPESTFTEKEEARKAIAGL